MTNHSYNATGGRRIVHGTPLTPIRLLDDLAGSSFCVSYARPDQLERCIDLVGEGEILILDNGAFSHWRSGKGAIDRHAFWDWANAIQARCPQAVAVIPDVIEGSEHENLLELSWALREGLAAYPERTMSIWHMNESQDFLALQCKLMNFVGIGSCAEYDVARNRKGWPQRIQRYLEKMEQVRITREAIDAVHGRCPWIHLMRGLGLFHELPWADSADSCNVAVNHSSYRNKWGDDRVLEMADGIEVRIQNRAGGLPVQKFHWGEPVQKSEAA